MATVRTVKRKKSVVYRAEICVKGHPRLSKSFDRKSEARVWAEDTEEALRNNGYVGNAPPDDMLFDNAWEKYLAEVSSIKFQKYIYNKSSIGYNAENCGGSYGTKNETSKTSFNQRTT